MVGGHATVGRLSNNVFWTFQAIRNFFEKSRWTVTRQWSEVTRPSADCQTTFFRRFKQLGKFWKRSLKGHATVVGGHATVGRLSNNVFWTFQAIRNFFEKSRWTVTRQWSEVTRLSADCQAHICMYIIINERERGREERETEYYVAFGRRIADEGVYEMLTCSKLNADLLDVFRGG